MTAYYNEIDPAAAAILEQLAMAEIKLALRELDRQGKK